MPQNPMEPQRSLSRSLTKLRWIVHEALAETTNVASD
jgi:hypothetical protein